MNEDKTPTQQPAHNVEPKQPPAPRRSAAVPLIMTGIVLVLCGLSFFAGTRYQQAHQTTAGRMASGERGGQRGGFGGPGMRGSRPVEGTVTAVSDSSITIKHSDGTSKTYMINSSTSVSNDRQTAAVSDIKTGDTVAIMTGSSNVTTAQHIILNPRFGAGPGMAPESDGGQANDNGAMTN